ncbi:hypothetical protein Pfo_009166 [Paulownia fortunei]|nr:hypothetical protein Pfo_009166 [Paulownia fortunei]
MTHIDSHDTCLSSPPQCHLILSTPYFPSPPFLSSLFFPFPFLFLIFFIMAPSLEDNSDNNIAAAGGGGAEDEMTPVKSRVTVVGSGNWGSVAAKLIASNTLKLDSFHDEVRMWVFEEILPTGEKLSEIINRTNENVKYLPGIKLGKNVVADPDLENAVRDAIMLVFVTPHQFMEGICKRLVGKIMEDVEAISLIKGMEVKREGPCMISSLISEQLGINCCVLMGANIANEIAMEKFSEATVGYRKNKEMAEKWVQLFNTSYFMVSAVQDVEGVELCGTLKNVVAIAAGFVDGLEMGNNTKAAIMRIGLREMKAFSKLLFPSVKDSTFFESCGVADLITTCLGEETGNVLRLLLGMVGRGLSMSSKQRCCRAKSYRVSRLQKRFTRY